MCTLGRPCNRSSCNFCQTGAQLALAGYHRLTSSYSQIPAYSEADLNPMAAEQALVAEASLIQQVDQPALQLLELQARRLGSYSMPVHRAVRAMDPWSVSGGRWAGACSAPLGAAARWICKQHACCAPASKLAYSKEPGACTLLGCRRAAALAAT